MGTEHPVLRDVWDFGDPEGSRKRFEELADTPAVRSDPGYHAEVLTQIARAHGLQQQFAEADAVLDRVDTMLTEQTGLSGQTGLTEQTGLSGQTGLTEQPGLTGRMGPAASVRSHLERGRVRNSSGHPADAVPFFTEALEEAQGAGLDDLAVDAAHMLGIVEPGEAGIAWNERALEMAEASTDPVAQRWKGSLLNNLGWAYHDRGDQAGALGMFERCLAYHTENGPDDRAAIARWSIAKMDRHLGRTAEAMEIQRALLERPDHKGNANEGYAREELAECLLAEGRADEAKPHFARAFELLHTDPWLARDEAPRLERLRDLGGA